jgi:PPM family protein phosphatase
VNLRPGNAQHQGAREAQQDSFGFSDLEDANFVAHAGVLGVVADGMGGLAHGGAAGAAAVHALLDAYAAKRPGEGVPGALLRALQRANDAVEQLARETKGIGEVGTTAAAAVVHEAALHWIAAGDSRIYLWRAGRLTQVTADHIYAADLDAKILRGQITEEDARADPDRDALTSHLGTPEVRRIDRSVTPYPLFEGDRVLVCSDGLYRALEPAELAAPLAGNPQRACEALVAHAVAKGLPRQDNMTVIIIGLDADGVTSERRTGELDADGVTSSDTRIASSGTQKRAAAAARAVLPSWLMWTLGGATAALTVVALVLAWLIWFGPARAAGTPAPKDAHVAMEEGRS